MTKPACRIAVLPGDGIANPVATMLSAVMMRDWPGARHRQPACTLAAEHLHAAIAHVLQRGPRTRDLGGSASTAEVTQAVINALPATHAIPHGR
jgi:3-isopropylmalate dehydrogenase